MQSALSKPIAITFCTIILLCILTFFVLDKPSDHKAYDEVIATMSMKKAQRFFNEHSNSRYTDILVNEITEWCNQEKTEECYRIVLDTIPKDHLKYKDLSSYYDKHFKVNK